MVLVAFISGWVEVGTTKRKFYLIATNEAFVERKGRSNDYVIFNFKGFRKFNIKLYLKV